MEKIGHILKPLLPKFRPDPFARKKYRRKTGRREAEADSRYTYPIKKKSKEINSPTLSEIAKTGKYDTEYLRTIQRAIF